MDTLIGVIFPYLAFIIFLIGAIFRVITWIRIPNKLNWKLFPTPEGLIGEGMYIIGEWVSFKTLFRNNRRVWLGSYAFHLSIVGLIIWLILFLAGISVPWLVRAGGWVMFCSCIYLLLLRIFVPQMRAISHFVEYFNLVLFALISITGLIIVGEEGLGEQARPYFLSLLSFSPSNPPSNSTFLLNIFLLEFFLAYFPFSKMFHVASKYFTYHKLRWKNPYEVLEKAH
ncbi:MAG: respiratory nitrate reductase subunit gamma [Candidatus Bathyarchaeia archaeon]